MARLPAETPSSLSLRESSAIDAPFDETLIDVTSPMSTSFRSKRRGLTTSFGSRRDTSHIFSTPRLVAHATNLQRSIDPPNRRSARRRSARGDKPSSPAAAAPSSARRWAADRRAGTARPNRQRCAGRSEASGRPRRVAVPPRDRKVPKRTAPRRRRRQELSGDGADSQRQRRARL